MIIQQVATTLFGIVLALTPLALWVAWSIPVMLLVIASGIVATIALLLCLPSTHTERSSPTGRPTLSDEFLSELSSMGPFIYHHQPTGGHWFRMKMERLRKLLQLD